MKDFTIKANKDNLLKFTGVVLIIASWEIIALFSHPLIVPSIPQTFQALCQLIISGEAATCFLITLQRQLTGLGLGVLLGVLFGILGGLYRPFNTIFMPTINTILATPSVIFVVMAMVWFGVGSSQAVFVIALLIFPIMYVNSVKALHSIDKNLLQMAQAFRVPGIIKVRKIYIPGILHGFIAGFTLSVASSLRLAVFAEVLGAQNGIGPAITTARNYLETDKLFAWAILLIVLITIIEFLILRPVENYMKKWGPI